MTFHEQSYQYFLQEAQELLQEIEQELFSLHEGYDINKVYNLMRATHTLKGAAASIGLEAIANISHSLEDIFRAICKPNLVITSEVEALLFESYECLYLTLNAEFSGSLLNETEILDRIAEIFAQLQEQMGDSFNTDSALPTSEELGFDLTKSIFEIGVTQRLEELAKAIESANPEAISSLLKTQAEVFFGLGESLNLPGFQAIAKAVLTALNNYPTQAVTVARAALANFQEARTLVLNGDRTQGGEPTLALQQLSAPQTRVTKTILNSYNIPESTFLTSEQGTSETASTPPFSSTVRVNVEHLEQLNYFIGEMLTNQNRQSLQNEQLWSAIRVLFSRLEKHQQQLNELTGDWESRGAEEQKGRGAEVMTNPQSPIPNPQSLLEDTVQLIEAAEAVEMFARQSQETLEKQRRLLTGTRDSLMEARTLPLGNLFGRFPRILQKLEIVHKKQIELEFQGSDTLVDKAVVERLYDPLLHLVRNAFDHGIESPSIRQKWGKPEKGIIEIRAYHQGRYLIVEVQDDGQGLDFEKIRAKAVEKQLILSQYAVQLSHDQLIDLLFEPGFSTVSNANELSGRGMGLDVVRNHLQGLQGTVSVYSEAHRGTMFRLQIPLSLTIDKLLVCQAGEKLYALFANAIEEIIIPRVEQVRCWDGGKALRWHKGDTETLIPIYQLATALNYYSAMTQLSIPDTKHSLVEEPTMMRVILVRCQERILGLEVDRLLGDFELAIRPLGSAISPPSYIYGASILADGRLTLVLDGTALIDRLSEQHDDNTNDFASSLPLIPDFKYQQSPIQTRAALAEASNFEEKSCKTILLVDDSITVRQTLALTLQKAGYQVVQAKDGYEAIEQIRYHSDIQLVFCDIEMPRMNGFEFLKTRQKDPTVSEIPVVMLTSRSSDKHRMLAFKLGANAYITKPYLEHMLLTTVTDVLEKRN
jgi:two-component system, chemotaxis family, sensor histidine kinase and response regulator PixL